MEVLDRRSALLSNYEVLSLLRELESDHLARTKTALRIKKEEEAAGNHTAKIQPQSDDICENLRTIEVEAIQYLSGDHQPIASQTDTGITQLTKNLAAYELTKAEKLQIVNLAPTEPVELYVVCDFFIILTAIETDWATQIVEELEDRLGQQMDEILDTVRSSLTAPAALFNGDHKVDGAGGSSAEPVVGVTEDLEMQEYIEEDGNWEYDAANDVVFDDTGEGAGVEGDLDVEGD